MEKETIIIKAKSSSTGSYNVTFENKPKEITVFCDCQAGMYGKLCKHKTELLNGNLSMLYDQSDSINLEKAVNWVKNSVYFELISKYLKIKKDIEKAKRNEKKLRAKIEKVLKQGIEKIDD